MASDWFLEMSMIGPFGEHYTVRLPLEEQAAQEFHEILPPPPGTISFSEAVTVAKRREFRRDLFCKSARLLGLQLAERMEDAEGWHDVSRVDKAKTALSRRS